MKLKLATKARSAAALLGAALLGISAPAQGQDVRFRDGRFLETLGGVTLQRADEAGSDEAVRNMPFLPGDRVWTDASGRAEIVFAEGEILWIAERSKVDSLGRGGREQDERLGLRVFAGSFGARVRAGGPGFEFRAPGGSVTTTGAAAFRVDARAGETVLSVGEGEVLANFANERVAVRAGEQVRYADGVVEGPYRSPRTAGDDFDRWCEDRFRELNRMARNHDDQRLPDELDPYADELDRNGTWVYDEPSGYVYVPRVAYDWAPYTYGRWVYTLYGWTWVADEPWGFATSHYGRWGYSSNLGWHWMPRAGFAGAWVGWSFPSGRWGHTVGWSALGFNDRPVGSIYGTGGRAVPRGQTRGQAPSRAWTFAERSDMGRAAAQRRRVDIPDDEAQRAAWNTKVAPDRNFRETVSAIERNIGRGGRGEGRPGNGVDDTAPRVYLRPSPGDSTPELRSDPQTTIPTPESRRRRTIGQDGFKDEQDNRRNRTRPSGGDAGFVSEDGSAPASDATRPRASDRNRDAAPRPTPFDDAPAADASRDRAPRDPLLNRFFRSITSQQNAERESGRGTNRSDDAATRRREAAPRETPSAGDGRSRERSQPQEARPRDPARERPAPGADRAQPRNTPAPQASPRGEDGRASRRRPQPGF
jgi:hypothetical protein